MTGFTVTEWIKEKELAIFDALITDPLKGLENLFLDMLPDLTTYAVVAGAGMVTVSSMMGRPIIAPLSFIAGVLILSVSILTVL